MSNLLIFFALPVATIILSGIFETLINCPFKIAGIAFSIYLIVAFAFGGTAELILAAIVYTGLSFITALIIMILQNRSNQNADKKCTSSSNNSPSKSSYQCGCRNR